MEKSCLTCKRGMDAEVAGKGFYCGNINIVGLWHKTAASCEEYRPQKQQLKETPTKMDKQTTIINHRHMWQWLSENPEKEKYDYTDNFGITPRPPSNCFLCQYAKEHHPSSCERDCLLVWPGVNCQSDESPFRKWEDTTDLPHRAELARQIRDLPERKKLREEDTADIVAREEMLARKRRKEKEKGKFRGFAGAALEANLDIVQDMRRRLYPEGVESSPTATEVRMKGIKDAISPPPKLTRAEAIAKTRKQWGWLSGNPDRTKEGYFNSIGAPSVDRPMYLCYLCEYTRTSAGTSATPDTCGKDCPLQWPGGCCVLDDKSGLFQMWADNKGKYICTPIADLISNLPEMPEQSP